jgi:Co/Zn/Cd efflux system component
MLKTVFDVPKMDCPSEERLIRMALDKTDAVRKLEFDLSKRRLTILHEGSATNLLTLLQPLGFGASIQTSEELGEIEEILSSEQQEGENPAESRVLKVLLAINATMFVAEIVAGWLAESTGLLSDSLDMFADAVVYGLSLYAVGKAASMKRRAARLSGYLQLVLALGAFSEVLRRFILGSEPEAVTMIGTATLALIANVSCLVLLARHRHGEVHMKASWIFSTNDVIANAGVIAAGILVRATSSHLPDLIIGAIIAGVVLLGATRILKLSR